MFLPQRTMVCVLAVCMASYAHAATLDDNLVIHLQLDGDTLDSSGNHYHGSSVGSLTATTDRAGNAGGALDMTGSNNYLSMQNVGTGPFQLDSFTISFWFKSTYNGGQNLLDMRSDTVWGRPGIGFHMHSFNDVESAFRTRDQGPKMELHTQTSFTSGSWNHIALVRDIPNNEGRLYFNGVAVHERIGLPRPNEQILPQSYAKFGIGLVGAMDDIRVYERALTDTEMSDLFNLPASTASPIPAPLAAVAAMGAIFVYSMRRRMHI